MATSLLCFSINALLFHHLAAHRTVSPWVSMSVRCLLGLILITAIYHPRRQIAWSRMFSSSLLISRGIIGAIGTACYYLTLGPLGAGKATLIGNTWCVFASLFAAATIGEPLTRGKVLSLLLALLGISLLTETPLTDLTHLGKDELIALAGALSAAAVIVVIRQLTRTDTAPTIFGSQCIYGALLALPLALTQVTQLSPADYGYLTLAAVVATIGQLAMTEGFRHLSVTHGSAWQMLVPLVITLSSIALFAEPFSPAQGLGAAITLIGCSLTLRKQATR